MSPDDARRSPGASRRMGAAIILSALAVLITCVRFPPADLTGWFARTLAVPLGVPFLVAALLFGASAWVIRTSRPRHQVFRVLTLAAAIVSAVIGLMTIATFV